MWNYPFTLYVRLNAGCKIGCQQLLKYKQIWYGIKPTRWLIKFNLTVLKSRPFIESLNGEVQGF